ncbi:MFS multidrug transporter [Aspergillus flavus]|nr:MFS multidrug transporter [Aspergillus flavus]
MASAQQHERNQHVPIQRNPSQNENLVSVGWPGNIEDTENQSDAQNHSPTVPEVGYHDICILSHAHPTTLINDGCTSTREHGSGSWHQKCLVSQLTFTIFMLAYAIGPLLLGPLSETIGRSPVLLASNVFYLARTLGCGLARNKAELIAFIFLAGVGGSAPLAVGAGVISDLWAPGERGQAVGIYSLASLLGPVIGPLTGGWITERTTWRWMFYSTSMAAGVVGVVSFVFIRETYTPVLLKQRQHHVSREETSGSNTSESLATRLRLASVRPLQFFVTEYIIMVVAIYMAAVFGVLYILLSTYPKVWTEEYGESPSIGALNYISLGLGYVLGSQINACSSDVIYRRLLARRNANEPQSSSKGEPEFRVPPMFVGSVLIPNWHVLVRVECAGTYTLDHAEYRQFHILLGIDHLYAADAGVCH